MITPPGPCLYCGSVKNWVWQPGPTLYAIACSDPFCASTGPVRITLADAIIAWNKPPRQDLNG